MKKYINLLIADKDKDFAVSLSKYYWKTPFVKAVNTTGNQTDLLKQIQHDIPDIILLELNLPGSKGLELCKQIRSTYPQTSIAIMANGDEKNLVATAKENGAIGCFLKRLTSTYSPVFYWITKTIS